MPKKGKNMETTKQQQQAQQQSLSQKAIENLNRNEESRRKDSKFAKLQHGEKATWYFDAEKMEPVESEFNGKKTIRYQYAVTDPNTSEEKYFTVSKRTSEILDAYLRDGKNLLKIQRIGAGKDTQYLINPV
jgi:hypothetical protein